jgi:hypothetical protein
VPKTLFATFSEFLRTTNWGSNVQLVYDTIAKQELEEQLQLAKAELEVVEYP